jgi:hypothetical protein
MRLITWGLDKRLLGHRRNHSRQRPGSVAAPLRGYSNRKDLVSFTHFRVTDFAVAVG